MPRMELFDGMVPFVTVAEAGSFREAARRLRVTASAISKAIAKLEHEVGVRLFQRSARSVTLTTDGERFLAGCRSAVDAASGARAQLADVGREPRGRLRVSLPPVLGGRIVSQLPQLLATHPAISLEVVMTDRFVQLVDENIDVAIRLGIPEDSTYIVRPLQQLALVTAAAPAYLVRFGTPRSPEQLAQHACIRFILPSGLAQPWSFVRDNQRFALAVDGNLAVDHGEGALAASLAGLGLVQAPDVMVSDRLASGELVEVLRDFRALGPQLSALCAPGRQRSPKVRTFIDFVASVVGADSAAEI
jgi:LysR family transcriptional regulator, regulator for bpeEF and oprC